MDPYKKYIFLLILCCNAAINTANAQDGKIVDTIFTNEKIDVAVNFYSEILNFYSFPTPSKFRIKSFPEQKQLRITTDRRFPSPEHLSVLIKRKTYQFIIAYKKNIDFSDFSETTYNYDEKKIEDLLEGRLSSRPNENKGISKTKGDKETAEKIQKNNDYFSILKQAYEKYKAQEYEESKALYTKALKMRPDEIMAKDGLAQVNTKLEEKEKQTKKLDATYKGYMKEGDRLLKQDKLQEAKLSFQQALFIKKDDPVSKQKLSEIARREDQAKQEAVKEQKYSSAMASAEKAFEHSDYKTAQRYYNEAISYFNRKEPNDQLKEISKALQQRQAEIASSNALNEQKEANEKKEKEKQQIQKEYYSILKKADNYYSDGNWDQAFTYYKKAKEYNFEDSYPADQMAKINKAKSDQAALAKTNAKKELIKAEKERKEQEQKELDKKYNTAISKADNLFDQEKFAEAKLAYMEAYKIIKKPWPGEQIKKIDQIVAAQAAQAKEEKIRAEKEKAETQQFNQIIKKADALLAKSEYKDAKKQYLNALSIKANENYPKQKIQFINETLDRLAAEEIARKEKLAAELELNRKYQLALSNGKSSIIKEDFANAKSAFTEALLLKPKDAEATRLLHEVESKLAEIARINDIENKYDLTKGIADSLLLNNDFSKAISLYQEAHNIKPEETYALSMIKYCNAEIKAAAIQKQQDEILAAQNAEIEKDKQFHDLMKEAADLVSEKDFEAAESKYAQALQIRPDDKYAQFRLKMCGDQMEMAKEANDMAKKDSKKKSKRKNNQANQQQVNPEAPLDSTDVYKPLPLPYNSEELAAKYPGINFDKFPDGQLLDDNFKSKADNLYSFKSFLAQKPDLSLSTETDNIKVTCQGIDFVYQTAYLKILIQNNGKEDFLTGPMMLTWNRTSGTSIKLYPLFLYPVQFPIITPGNEALVVYGFNSYKIGSSDKLNLEISDRPNRINISLEIKGSVYEKAFNEY